jgi:prevent-host-death family protein
MHLVDQARRQLPAQGRHAATATAGCLSPRLSLKANLAILAKIRILQAMANTAPASQTFGFSSVAELSAVTASVLKNKFSEVARLASTGPLAVSRHNRREVVILTAGQYEELQQSRRAPFEGLTAEFDQMVAMMNTPADRAARRSFFKASAAKPSAALAKLKKARAHAR